MEDPLDDLLLRGFYGSMLGTLIDDGLDFLFSYLTFIRFQPHDLEDESGEMRQQPYKWVGKKRNHPHRSCNTFGNTFWIGQPNALRNKFSKNQGEKSNKNYNKSCGNFLAVGHHHSVAFKISGNIIHNFIP